MNASNDALKKTLLDQPLRFDALVETVVRAVSIENDRQRSLPRGVVLKKARSDGNDHQTAERVGAVDLLDVLELRNRILESRKTQRIVHESRASERLAERLRPECLTSFRRAEYEDAAVFADGI